MEAEFGKHWRELVTKQVELREWAEGKNEVLGKIMPEEYTERIEQLLKGARKYFGLISDTGANHWYIPAMMVEEHSEIEF